MSAIGQNDQLNLHRCAGVASLQAVFSYNLSVDTEGLLVPESNKHWRLRSVKKHDG